MKRKLLLFVIFIVFPCVTFAQSIWNNPITGTNPNSANPYTTGQTVASNLTALGIGRSPNLTGSPANDRYNATGWGTSFNANNYFEFTLTPTAGYKIDFNSLVYTSTSNNISGVSVRSSIDGFASDIATLGVGGGTVSLSGSSFQNVGTIIKFRIYAWGSGVSRTFSIDNFTFNGNVSCIASPTTTGTSICQGDSGVVSATFSPGTGVTTNTFSGSWNAATDPTARIITTSMQNNTNCGFANVVRNYTATTFTVDVSGTYTFKMTDTSDYDGMAYIYSEGLTPGTCGTGWVVGDDDVDGSQREPRMTPSLTAGVVYTLISTTYSNVGGTYTGNYSWTVTPPSGGQVTLATVGWYTQPSGGSLIGTGSPFNPVGVANSGLPNTNTPGTYSFYASAGGTCSGRTVANFVISAKPVISAMTASICSDGNFSVTPVNGTNGTVPSGTTYSWPIPTMPAGVKGGVAGSGASVISGTLTNFSTTAQNVVYTVTPLTGSCSGTPFTVTVTVNPGDVNNRITLAGSTQICNQVQEYNNLTLTAPTGNYFNNVSFASYGLPNGSCGSFTVNNSCHSTLSQSVAESYLLGNSNTVTIAASNSVFDDGCVGLEKRLYIAANYSQPICSGTVPGTISGSLPTGTVTSYLWETSTSASGVFSNAPGTNNTQNYTPTVAITQDTWFRRKVTINGCTNISGLVLVKVTPLPTITHSTTATAICAGTVSTALSYSAVTGTPTSYSIVWNSTPANSFLPVSNASLTTTPINIAIPAAANPGTYTGTLTVRNANGCTSTGTTFTVTVNPNLPASVSIAASPAGAICAGTSVTFTATPTNGGTAPTYQWYNGASLIPSATNSTYTTTGLANGNAITVRMTSNASPCLTGSPATSNAINMTVNPNLPASVSIAASPAGAICAGTSVTFTATPTNGGTAPTYQWYNGASLIPSATNSTYTTTGLANGNAITVRMTSNASPCLTGSPATSNAINMTVNPNLPASVSIAASPAGAICAGTSVTFTATPTNGGSAPTYQWYNGASLIPSATNSTYTTTGLANGNTITVRMTSNASPCLTGSPATSNAINMTVNPNLPASVSIAASPAGAICAGTSVTFTATPTNGGTAPTYQWYNGASLIPSATNSTYTTTGLANGNTITVRMTSNASPCLTGSPATSNAINATVNPVPTTPTANVDSNVTCSNTGTITLSALPSSGAWTIHQTGTASQNIPGTGGSTTISGLAVGTYNFTVENASGCISGQVTADITDDSSTTWNGTTWSQGLPNNSKAVIFAAPFTITADLQACSLTINSGNTVTVNPNVTLTITNAVTTNGQLIFENNSSLIQTTNATNNGYITYKRNTQPVRRYDFTYWSTPVTGADNTLHNLSPNTLLDKYYSYDAAGEKWVIKNYGNVNMEYGVGYIVRAPQSYSTTVPAIYTGSFIGTPNNGPYTIHPVSGNWNLIGNPYPSALDAEELIDVNHLAGTDVGALYFWTHNTPPSSSIGGSATNNYTSNDYAVFSLTGGVVTTSGAAQPTGYIASGQGFFAQPAGNEILFNNSMRVGGNNAQFFKTAKTSKIEKNRLWLNFTNSQGAFKQALIGYVENATNKMDINYDAVTMASNSFVDFYSINDKDLLTIQARALPFDKADIVPLGYKTTVAGNFTIGIDHTDGFFAEQAVYLEDKKTGTIHDLRTADYTFTTAVGTFADRFVLRYTSKTLGTGDFENIDESVLIAVKDKKVSIISTKENLKEVTIFNVGGQLVFNKKKINTTELRINDLQVADQVLMVKVALENGHTLTKKIIFY
ncbi:T9SS sorting signal type C domain-containing protein [Flavobacterium foetidum]|uniref:T9SS sorting signal type C domain-containing protein n=1 Tax=Flavobacterium foetidum TaxID=2026681 RepID=UPI0013C2C96F|nr:T9SS sorting signal type C domain-containing protein [Flavobacterium foetidum]KAF2514541.1 T9SS sorting signal type C domain-containing protein [Flavobacterium foetidum]